ncbi:MAG: hypothetical protein IJS01_00220 [Lentisphaeria bacterium]|nr:hypothetical protein [Lentisphaeria bacterium]
MADVCISAGEPRGRKKEAKVSMTSKAEFAHLAFPAGELQRALSVSQGGTQDELQLGEHLRIVRDTPAFPGAPALYGIDAKGISGSHPLIAGLKAINYGITDEVLLPSCDRYPVLNTVLKFLQARGCEFSSVAELAGQIAPALNLSGEWNDPIVRRKENTWQEAKIEYEQYPLIKETWQERVVPVRDFDGFIRHLILETVIGGERVIVPLTFAKHPKFRQPMVCYFAFSPKWWLLGSEQLKWYPKAEVWITNTLGCTNSVIENPPRRIFLSYCFGRGMIPHLELDCLRGRDVKVLIGRSKDKYENRRNLEEGVLLASRLKDMDIKVGVKTIEEACPSQEGRRHNA